MSVKRTFLAVAPITLDNGHAGVIVAGGFDDSNPHVTLDLVEFYDIVTNEWTTAGSFKLPVVPL